MKLEATEVEEKTIVLIKKNPQCVYSKSCFGLDDTEFVNFCSFFLNAHQDLRTID